MTLGRKMLWFHWFRMKTTVFSVDTEYSHCTRFPTTFYKLRKTLHLTKLAK